jgi:hypothetical protein
MDVTKIYTALKAVMNEDERVNFIGVMCDHLPQAWRDNVALPLRKMMEEGK